MILRHKLTVGAIFLLLNPKVQGEGPAGGGALLAMAGKGCVAVAVDRRQSSALLGGQPLIGSSARRVLRVHDNLLLGLSGNFPCPIVP
jgi:20S proteasome alpha/beta subunit